LAIALMLFELATEMDHITGGFDGLNFSAGMILGFISFDSLFYTTNYWYALFFLFICFVFIRCVVHSPFGRSLVGIREHPKRMTAIGAPVHGRLITVYVMSGAIAGIAGAVFAQVQGNVTPEVYAFELSGEILIMVILGGLGRLYGAFIGATLFMILQQFTETILGTDLPWWMLIIGVALVLTVMFAPRGLLGIGEDARKLLFRKPS